MHIDTNVVWSHLKKTDKKIVIEQGGTRSGKTYNILLWLIFHYAENNTGKTVSIFRVTYPALRATVMRDFFDILNKYDLYVEADHNKSNSEYKLNGNLFEFISVDQPSRLKGRKRDLAFLNEANEFSYEQYNQILFRTASDTSPTIILDYNPSDEYSWIYTKVKTREDADFYITTYKNNPFLEPELIAEIERLRETDEDYWRIYGLGQVGRNRATIFNFTEVTEIPQDAKLIAAGLDFGYVNDPSCCVITYKSGDNLYIKELFYEYAMTNEDIHNKLLDIGFDPRDEIFADSAEPKSIDFIRRMGRWNIKPTLKGKDSILAGIDILKRHKLHITSDSTNTLKEFRNYKWVEDKNGVLLNKPVPQNDHTADAVRYSIFTKLSRPNFGRYAIR